MDKNRVKWGVAVIGPLLVVSVYLLLSRWPTRSFSTSSDYIAIGVAIAVGLFAIASLNTPTARKITISIIYVPVSAIALLFFTLVFVCIAFGDCL